MLGLDFKTICDGTGMKLIWMTKESGENLGWGWDVHDQEWSMTNINKSGP